MASRRSTLVKAFCLYPTAVLVAVIAVFIGWMNTHPIPEGVLFATIVPLANGRLPATIFGEPAVPLVPAVPDDARPAPRPENEMFLELPSGAQMPASGLGLCCRASAYEAESVRRSVLHYLLLGGRLLDTAQIYLNHRAVGLGIKDAVALGIPRAEIFVTTKLPPRFFAGDAPTEAVRSFLAEGPLGLGLDYLDLVLLHHPEGFGAGTCAAGTPKECRQNAWKHLTDLRNAGVIRDIGVSNFNMRQFDELGEVPGAAAVAVNQLQWNPFAPQYQHDVVKACQARGIAITAWGSFQGTMMQHGAAFAVTALKSIAEDQGRSVPQVLLRRERCKRGPR